MTKTNTVKPTLFNRVLGVLEQLAIVAGEAREQETFFALRLASIEDRLAHRDGGPASANAAREARATLASLIRAKGAEPRSIGVDERGRLTFPVRQLAKPR